MSRLIDADVIYQWYRDSFDFKPNEVKFSMLDIRDNLENIPTADVPNMTGDLISRQQALSTIEANQGTLNKRRVMKILEGLPSAEPEIIRCKDCRHGVDYYHEGDCYCLNPKYGLMYFGGSWEFYCADAEPREEEGDSDE